MKNVLILEDNPVAMKHIENVLNELDVKCKVYSCVNIQQAYQYAVEQTIHLFIIDIILDTSTPGDTSGLKYVSGIRDIERYAFTPVIFITSLEDAKYYTYEKLHGYSFVEKPFDTEEVKKTIEKCMTFPAPAKEDRSLFYRRDGIILSVNCSEIVYLESIHHVLHIHLVNGDTMKIPYITLKRFLEDADCPELIQCNRSTIFHRNSFENADWGNGIIKLKGCSEMIRVGVMFKKKLKEIFK